LQAAAINDPPEFDAGDDVQVAKNSGTYSQPWATNIAAAAGLLADPQRALDELSQTVEFVIFVNRPELFDVPPEVSSSGMLSFTPAVDAVGTAVVTVRSVDNGPSGSPHDNDSVPATLTITIQPTNNPPVALDDQFETDENSVLTVAGPGLLENDTDPDLPGDLLSVIPGVRQSSLKARVEVQEDGSFTYEPADVEVIDSLLVGETLQDTFTYVLRDQSNDQSDVATVVILVSGVNDPPVAVDDHMSVMTNFATTHDLLANDHDVDSQLDPASIVITRLPSAGTAEVTSEGLLRYTPAPGFVGTDSLSYTVRDAQGLLSNEAMVTLEIITSPWQNQSQNVDVNGNGRVTAMDALEIINYLNSGQPTRLSESNLIPPPHLDVNGDGRVTALDALLVINHLNNRGEGEAAQTQPTSLASPDDWLVLISQEVTKRRRGWL
jgi:VCBS repeat-containing protein